MSQTCRFQGWDDYIGGWVPPTNAQRLSAPRFVFGLFQIATEALDAAAGILEVLGLGRIGDPERRPEAERRSLHHRDAFGLEQLGDEVLVIAELVAVRRRLADRAGAGRIDI